MDIAELIWEFMQERRIDEAQASASMAGSVAARNKSEVASLAEMFEKRFRELEQENAMLGLLLVRLLKHFSESQPEQMQGIIDEVAATFRQNPPANADFLRTLLDLPPRAKTSLIAYKAPVRKPKAPLGKRPPVAVRAQLSPPPKKIGPAPQVIAPAREETGPSDAKLPRHDGPSS